MKKIATILFICLLCACSPRNSVQKGNLGFAANEGKNESFSFLFMCDIHLQPENGAVKGFKLAIDTANKMNADFVLTGGDLVYDALGVGYARADSLFKLYAQTTALLKVPVFNTVGNHDLFGIYPESNVDKSHPDYKYGLFRKYLGKTYYSFDHKGWHFIVLNSVGEKDRKYIGEIDEEQKKWLQEDLSNISSETPVAIVVHIPFLSTYWQRHIRGPNPRSPEGAYITNRTEILNMLEKHNLRLVLQGHTHWIEDIYINNKTRFITGGSVSGHSWRGNKDVEKGFMRISINGADISWEYIEYGWKPEYAN